MADAGTIAGAVTLEKVGRNFSLTDHVYGELRQAILDARIYDAAADLRLDERSLADQLGISRTPVREALARLAQEGLVAVVPRKGVFIVRKTQGEILEMITVWAALESMAARRAAELATNREIAALDRLAGAYEGGDAQARIEEYAEANMRFHQAILEAGHCAMLRDIADGLFVHVRAVRSRAMHEADRAVRSVADHRAIVDAIALRDPELAGERVLAHTMGLHDHVAAHWDEFLGSEGG